MASTNHGLVCLTADDVALVRTWLSRCLVKMGTLPPSAERSEAMQRLREHLDGLPASNVIAMQHRGAI